MKAFCATIVHESNSFSPIPTDLSSFSDDVLYRPSTGEGGEHLKHALAEVNLVELMNNRGHEAVVGLIANAEPSAPASQETFELLRDELLDNLKMALPVDFVFLFLHGAQMAEGYDDCEGEIISCVREIVGQGIPIGIVLDLHCNITETMVDCADIITTCKEYPHIDFGERAEQVVCLLEQISNNEITPITRITRIPMLGLYVTTGEPMRSLVDDIIRLENDDDVLSLSLCHGFNWSDVSFSGACALAITNDKPAKAQQLANNIAERFWCARDAVDANCITIEKALGEIHRKKNAPALIADTADNPGGGASGDSTFILRALLDNNIEDAALAMIWDPVAVNVAAKAGVGAHIPLRLGGKISIYSGDPLDVIAEVMMIRDDATQLAQGMRQSLGLSAHIRIAGVDVIVNSIRQQTFSPECFTCFGIDPMKKAILVVKSSQHFHETFSSFTNAIYYVSSPGQIEPNFWAKPFSKLQRPIWPIDSLPFSAFGRTWH